MTSVLLTREAPPRSHYAWQVETLTRTGGLAQAQRHADHLQILVADAPYPAGSPADAAAPDAHSRAEDTTEAWLYGDGRIVVRSHVAPPALLVTASGARLLPPAPDVECSAEASDGDVLVMCSSQALDHLPTGLGGVLACSPLRVGAHDPDALLEQLMAGSQFGAALIARCTTTVPNQPTGPDDPQSLRNHGG